MPNASALAIVWTACLNVRFSFTLEKEKSDRSRLACWRHCLGYGVSRKLSDHLMRIATFVFRALQFCMYLTVYLILRLPNDVLETFLLCLARFCVC